MSGNLSRLKKILKENTIPDMSTYSIAIHGGAGPDSAYIQDHHQAYLDSLERISQEGMSMLSRGVPAMDVVQQVIILLEDDPLYNAGRGSALNCNGIIEMDASIMDGHSLQGAGVAMLRNIKNPILAARLALEKTDCTLVAGEGAISLAREGGLKFEDEFYFLTEHQVAVYQEARTSKQKIRKHGTVGAVVSDKAGHLAAGVSTGGLIMKREGRIGDTAIIGAGCYADDRTCAAASTGDGEYIIRASLSKHLSLLRATGQYTLQAACDLLIHGINAGCEGDMGIIAVAPNGEAGMAFNSERMHRAYMSSEGKKEVAIYK